MGLIKAIIQGTRSTLADQWLDYIYCDALPEDILMRKGQKRIGPGSSNTSASDNVITQGSHIAVNEGQFMLVVDDGKIIDFTDEPGTYTFDKSTEPSLFYGGFGKGLLNSFSRVGKRFTFGGDTGHDQRVYFVNKKLITDNKFGTKAPIPFRDSEWNMTINIRCFGTYVYRIYDPILFYDNLCANVSYEYRRDAFEEQFKSDLCGALLPALSQVAAQKVSYDMLPSSTEAITEAVKSVLKKNWEDVTGINVDRVVMESVAPTDEDAAKIQKFQETRVYENAAFQNAAFAQAQAGMIKDMGTGMAKGNVGGAAIGDAFGGIGLAMMGNMMGMGNPLNMNRGGAAGMPNQQAATAASAPDAQAPAVPAADSWTCACGVANTGKFCVECGKPKPDAVGEQQNAAPSNAQWACECGVSNIGKFCTECGKPKPVVKRYKCDKCGWTPSDPTNPPKFCPECGDIFNDADAEQ